MSLFNISMTDQYCSHHEIHRYRRYYLIVTALSSYGSCAALALRLEACYGDCHCTTAKNR